MALGFTPKHVEQLALEQWSADEFLVLANEAAIQLGWKVGYLSHCGLIAYTDNGMFSWNAEIKLIIQNGTASVKSASTGSEMMDWGRNKKNVNNFLALFRVLETTFSKEELAAKHLELSKDFVSAEDDVLRQPPATIKEQIGDILSLFVPRPSYFVTPILLDLNILIFVIMAISGVNVLEPDSESLVDWGANFKPMTLGGEWWRLITNCFLHIGIIHLLMNAYALLSIGVLLEPYLGRSRFICAYLLSGLIASIASLWWHDLTISAGASGAIFGLYGVFLAMLTTNLIEKTARKTLLTSIAIFVGYNLIYGLKAGIDNAAHVGGLVGGLIIGYAMIPSLKKPEDIRLKWRLTGLVSVVILTFAGIVYERLPNDIGSYDAQMKEFSSIESTALAIYDLPASTPNDTLLFHINDKGIHYWKKNLKILNSVEKLDLPPEIKSRNMILREYCDLRIKCYTLMYKAISENTDRYQPQIDGYNQRIQAKIKEL